MWGEIHVFRGRMFVTRGRWTTGVHAGADLSDAALGESILGLCARPSASWSEDGRSWQTFCTDVAGVSAQRYRPEKHARVFLDGDGGGGGGGGIWCVAAGAFRNKVSIPAEPPGDLPQRLGALVRRELAALAPHWPRVRSAVIRTSATGRWVVTPYVDGFMVGPARVVDTESGPLLAAVRAALMESGEETADTAATAKTTSYADGLAAAGIDPRLLDGCAEVMFDELSDGSVRVVGVGSAGNRAVAERTWLGRADDLAAACHEVARMLRALPVEHLPPGTPSGRSFGVKRTWLAVRGSSVEEVAAAVGLTGSREAGWDEGVASADGDQAFISPPVAGWILVVNTVHGFGAPSTPALSARLGTEVQYFGNHRVSGYAEWARAADGRLVRHVLCGEALTPGEDEFYESGVPTPVETEMGYPGAGWADEDDVMRVAAAWSIDPTTLDVIESSPRSGLLGRFGEAA